MNSFDFDDFADHFLQEEHNIMLSTDEDTIGIFMSDFVQDSIGREDAGMQSSWSTLNDKDENIHFHNVEEDLIRTLREVSKEVVGRLLRRYVRKSIL